MKCYRCGCELGHQEICIKCGAPLTAYRVIVQKANALYNSALKKAKVRDLTGAISDLQLCLEYYKRHVQARNLLGLIYCEIGEVSAALCEWVISQNVQPENNLASSLMDKVSKPREIDQYNTAVKKYNHSLRLLKGADRSADLALLELNKVVRVCPKFLKAYQLMALIYIYNGEYVKAHRVLKDAFAINKSDPICLKYRQEISHILGKHGKEQLAEQKAAERKAKRANDNSSAIIPTYREGSGIFQAVLYVAGGIVLGLLICRFLVLPSFRQDIQRQSNEKVMDYGDMISAKDAEISELQAEVESLQEEKDAAQAELEGYTGSDGVVQAYETMISVLDAYYSGDYVQAADLFEEIKDIQVSGKKFSEVQESLSAGISEDGADVLFELAKQAYDEKRYADAITHYTEGLKLQPDNPEAMYWLGLSYHNNGDLEMAKQYYNRIIEEYPDSRYAQRAANLLGGL